MEYIQYITLDINSNNAYVVIPAKQGDNNARKVNITVQMNGIRWPVPADYSSMFRCRKPDGTAIMNPATIMADGTIMVDLTAQTLAVAGRAYADVGIYDGADLLSTISFIINIMSTPNVTERALSSSEFLYLQEMVNNAHIIESDMQEQVYNAEAWAKGTRNSAVGQVMAGTQYYSDPELTTLVGTTEGIEMVQELTATYGEIILGELIYFVSSNDVGKPEEFHSTDNSKHWSNRAEAWSVGTLDGVTVPESDETYENNSKHWSHRAEAWSTGTIEGVAVPETDETHENNSKYWSEQAELEKEAIHNMTVSAIDRQPGQMPTVTKTINPQTHYVNLEFGIPEGQQGIGGTLTIAHAYTGNAGTSVMINDYYTVPTGTPYYADTGLITLVSNTEKEYDVIRVYETYGVISVLRATPIVPINTYYYSDTALTNPVGRTLAQTNVLNTFTNYASIQVGSTTYYVALSDVETTQNYYIDMNDAETESTPQNRICDIVIPQGSTGDGDVSSVDSVSSINGDVPLYAVRYDDDNHNYQVLNATQKQRVRSTIDAIGDPLEKTDGAVLMYDEDDGWYAGDASTLGTVKSVNSNNPDDNGNVTVGMADISGLNDAINAKYAKPSTGIPTSDIADGAVTYEKIAVGAVTNGKIASSAVDTTQLATGAVTSAKLGNTAVTTDKLATGAVTYAKIASNAVDTNQLIDGAVTSAKLGAGAATEAKIADGAVTTNKIASSAVTADKIYNGAVTTDKIYNGAVTKEVSVRIATTGWQPITGGYYGSVTVSGVSANSTVIVTPAPSFIDKWGKCKLRAAQLYYNNIRFECETIPDEEVTANVLIFKVVSETI